MDSTSDATAPDASATHLGPREERGGTLLICGGSSTQRRARLDACVHEVTSSAAPRPLIVRVSTRESATSLADAIAASAEAELARLGAPGGLYDDPAGGPLASLGGWLFRARAVRRHGVLVVLDDIDAWIDARGASEANPLTTVQRILVECARRPLSFAATARAADASGEPAIAPDLARAFERIERLGGAPTVTRDPMDLVGRFAGRSFTVGALRTALEGWLEIPAPSDDTVVVFTSPLGPPAIGYEPDAEVTFARTVTDANEHGATTASPRESMPPAAPPLGEGWADAVRAAVTVRDSLRAMRGIDARRGARQWERLFVDSAARLGDALGSLERGEQALGLEGTRLASRGRETLQRFEQHFRDYYANAYDAWLAGTSRPTMLCDLPGKITRTASERQARGTAFVIVTGLRVDAWQRIRDRVLPRVPGLAVIEEGIHWAGRPATTRTQRELLVRGLTALGAELPARDEPAAARTFDESIRPRREHLGHHEVLRIDAYALEASIAGKGGLSGSWDRIEKALAPALLSLCGSFASRTVFAIAGDAGMRENGSVRDEGSEPRGLMGGDSAFEVLVPYALLSWGFAS